MNRSNSPTATLAEKVFHERFGEAPHLIVRAPGRVNLIGEHTDYNDGFVLPMAIERAVYIALRPTADTHIRVLSLDFSAEQAFDLGGFDRGDHGWMEYIKGTAWSMMEVGFELSGWEGVVAGDVPVGAGLSSSAALEMATARACCAVSEIPWDAPGVALLGQRAENEWVGVNCGIMDQMISASAVAGSALLIDCRTLETTPVPLPAGHRVVVMDTATRRGLVDSAYNERRRQCERAARFLGVEALRDVSVAEFAGRASGLDPLARKRARHVITENERTLASAEAMKRGDAATVGRFMNEGHASLRDDFEVSSEGLDTMVAIARTHRGCQGARMTGAGFGGCAVALVQADSADAFVESVARLYQEKTGLNAALYVSGAAGGAEVLLDRRP